MPPRQFSKQTLHPCKIGSKVLTSKQSLVNHTRRHTGEFQFKCDKRTKPFMSKSALNLHLISHNKKSHKCSVCSRDFPYLSTLKIHMTVHSDEKPYKCSKCSKCFAQLKHLHAHQVVHTGSQAYQCTHCMKKFGRRGNYHGHLKTHMQELKQQNIPDEINNANDQLKNYRIRKFCCIFCNKAYFEYTPLHRNILVHIGEKPYECDLCEETFYTSSEKFGHLRRFHTLEKTYSCHVCEAKFLERCNLKSHLWTHPETTEEKRYQCLFCDKTFHRNQRLHEHILVHIREKPYACELCGREFNCIGNKNQHIRRRHT